MIDLDKIRDHMRVAEYTYRERYCCKVCGAVPDADGTRDHGRGCYQQHVDGGGTDHVDIPPDPLLSALPELLDFIEAGRNLLARIHRDGGQYQDERGSKQAFVNADARVIALMSVLSEASDFAKIANLPFGDYTQEYRRAKTALIGAVYAAQGISS